jgi:hypothetical protein
MCLLLSSIHTFQSLVTETDVVFFFFKINSLLPAIILIFTSVIPIITTVSLFHLRHGFNTSIPGLNYVVYGRIYCKTLHA